MYSYVFQCYLVSFDIFTEETFVNNDSGRAQEISAMTDTLMTTLSFPSILAHRAVFT